jgi:hypothetical protein
VESCVGGLSFLLLVLLYRPDDDDDDDPFVGSKHVA